MENRNLFDIQNRNYLITGAASGIGRSTSIILSQLGANLLLIDVNKDGLEETISQCRGKTTALIIDITDSEMLKSQIVAEVKKIGKLHGFAHVAGKSATIPLKAISQEACMDIFRINTYTAIELSKIYSNRGVYNEESGSIVLISSIYGLVGSSANIAYSTSKAALHGVTKSLSIELAPRKIRVNCIAPGFVKTEMMAKNNELFNNDYLDNITRMHPLGLGDPNDIAYSIAFLLSDAARWITGSIISVDGGFTAQ